MGLKTCALILCYLLAALLVMLVVPYLLAGAVLLMIVLGV